MPKVSVVIPVYNTGALLDRTLGSVTRQTLSDIEIICIDDCSTDDSLTILRRWEQQDTRIRVIAFPDNGGVSRARNAGIDAARAPYIYFLDSDDWIDDDYLEAMYSKAMETGQSVVVNSSVVREYENTAKAPEIDDYELLDPGFCAPSYIQSHMLNVLWARLYKRDHIVDNGIRFPEEIRHGGEDAWFIGLTELLQPRSYVFPGPFYHYWQRLGSLAHSEAKDFSYIRSYRLLYEELVARAVPLDGLRLFGCGFLNVDTREKFDFIRSYLLEAGSVILDNRDNYTVLDNLVIDAVISSPDYETFRAHHHPNPAIEYLRGRLKNNKANG